MEPQWYPVAAVPCLFITVLVAIVLPRIVSLWQKHFTDNGDYDADEVGPTVEPIKPRDEEETFEVLRGRSLQREISRNRPSRSSQSTTMEYPQTLVSGITHDYTVTHAKAASIRSGMAYHTRRGSNESFRSHFLEL